MVSSTAAGTPLAPARFSVGVCDSSLAQRSLGIFDESGPTGPNTDSGHLQDTATVIQWPDTTTGAREAEASVSGFSANTVTLSWPDLPATAALVEVVAWYGTPGASKVFDWTAPGSITPPDDVVDVLGIGFPFGLLRLFSHFSPVIADHAAAHSILAEGWATQEAGVIRQLCHTHYGFDRPNVQTRLGGVLSNTHVLRRFTLNGNGGITEGPRLEVDAVLADGFRLRQSNSALALEGFGLAVNLGTQRRWCGIPAVVAPAGGGADVAELPTSSTGTHTVKDPGFKAAEVEAVLVSLNNPNATVSGALAGRWARGSANATEASCSSYVAATGSPSNSRSLLSAKFAVLYGTPTTLDWDGDLVLGSSLGFGVNVGTASPADRESGFFVLGEETLLTPDPVALALAVQTVARLVTVTPSPVALALAVPAVARLVTVTPAPVALALAVQAVARLVTLTPAPVELDLAVATVARLLTLTPAPVELELAVPAPAILTSLTPAPVPLGLALPAPSLLGGLTPAPVPLGLAVPAPAILTSLTPAPVPLGLAVLAPAVQTALTPDPVPLGLVVPPVTMAAIRILLRLRAELDRIVRLEAALARTLRLEGELGRAMVLEARVARALELDAEIRRTLGVRAPLE
jgi:hypothetical protein